MADIDSPRSDDFAPSAAVTFGTFDLYVPAGGTSQLLVPGASQALPGRWLPADVKVDAEKIHFLPRRMAGGWTGGEFSDVAGSQRRSWFPASLPTSITAISIPLSNVTVLYDQFSGGSVPLTHFSHEAASPRYSTGQQLKVLLRHLGHAAEHVRWQYVEDAALLLRTESMVEQSRLYSALRQHCHNLHDGDCSPPVTSRTTVDRALTSRSLFGRMILPLKRLTSKNKFRFEEDGYSLDLAYITPTIIAAGVPTPYADREHWFRNDIAEVQRLLHERHPYRYRVVNLCSERTYPPSAFMGCFTRYPFDDHEAPPLELLLTAVKETKAFLEASAGNTVMIHCKAGKGRTGVVIVALRFLLQFERDPAAASLTRELSDYAQKRAKDAKGVNIPSQLRFLGYFERCVRELDGNLPLVRAVAFTSCSLTTTPWINLAGGCTPFVVVKVRPPQHHHRALGRSEWRQTSKAPRTATTTEAYMAYGAADAVDADDGSLITVFDSRRYEREALQRAAQSYVAEPTITIPLGSITVADEVYFGIYDGTQAKPEYMCGCWLHTAFLDGSAGAVTVTKAEIDGASKGSGKDYFDERFALTFEFTPLPPVKRDEEAVSRALVIPQVHDAAAESGAYQPSAYLVQAGSMTVGAAAGGGATAVDIAPSPSKSLGGWSRRESRQDSGAGTPDYRRLSLAGTP
jgi:phosphatidylinositol-3,4,5-trisphosphate 3-phosphatase/dual-specificity protein phosphatase PTEN